MADAEDLKRAAAARALTFVTDGMRLGLGTGSTARHFVDLLAVRVREGLKVVGVPTSEQTRAQALSLGVPLATLDELPELDLCIDGADEVGPDLALIKGGGGALLREKIVASAAREMVVIADASKHVAMLGRFPLPIEVVDFGVSAITLRLARALKAADCAGDLVLRRVGGTTRFVTDQGNLILDAHLDRIPDPAALAREIEQVAGVVEHGLFLGLARRVILAGPGGIELLERSA
ncbi:MAG: ribose 5-phosphate isomerase A [Rhizobiales bacterium 24-66-13]|jgi:ribose 5-phosphate isomerase A|uniref:ribose-5-phosphate isomerase RpiA n=1 Tax=Roseixanthobacter finlandensis TaxID=3119922 RepID=UPI000BCD2B0A|nr:MAG: ribose 5-phosphate isomerase A [Rhizobiales bacterium 24-66-13]OZB02729.1 MAG: ribose 5-phosphate isomerase A [Rhizobiales bacterium 39-66-18]HQS08771.1 ribose-5-phosphate isomerase RpiA [Xanthobacteraceae bacterium]HQS47815.1 ribose-5-phosphate isomerase RpiA [Xanthobacteraceae bacterium]